MPLIVTPGRLSRQAEFYHQLGTTLGAGLRIDQALAQLHRAPPAAYLRKPIAGLIDGLAHSLTFAEATARIPGWLPSFDLSLLAAGEKSGRLDTTCRLLASYYTGRAQLARKVLGDMAYPVFLLHAVVLIMPFPQLFLTGDFWGYLRQTGGFLGPVYLAVLVVLVLCQGRRGELWRGILERVLHPIPVLGTARRHLALARLSAALEALLHAGVTVVDGWPLAAAGSGSPALKRLVAGWVPAMLNGTPPGDLLPKTSAFPDMFTNLYCTGEISGTLEDALKRLQAYYQEDATRKLRMLAEWLPRLVYLVLLIVIAISIIGFWVGYYDRLLNTPM